MDFDIAEALGEGDELVLVEVLAVEHQDLVREPGGFDRVDISRVEPGEIDPRHLADKALGQSANAHSHDDPPADSIGDIIKGDARRHDPSAPRRLVPRSP